eukprot:GILJ01001988.1.p1 GENE.GILJ01001988.1~~GILJ01001988.1.p1  ORF type:complete len:218 (+),score=23.86 GILJ01001988.1:28-681(+)
MGKAAGSGSTMASNVFTNALKAVSQQEAPSHDQSAFSRLSRRDGRAGPMRSRGGRELRKEEVAPYASRRVVIKTAGPDDGKWQHDLFDGVRPASTRVVVVDPVVSAGAVVFVRNLPPDVSAQFVRTVFEEAGSLLGVKVDRGTAEVTFARKDVASKAVTLFHGRTVRGRKMKVALVEKSDATASSSRDGQSAGDSSRLNSSSSSEHKSVFDRLGKRV